jgi:hypothetical protein
MCLTWLWGLDEHWTPLQLAQLLPQLRLGVRAVGMLLQPGLQALQQQLGPDHRLLATGAAAG